MIWNDKKRKAYQEEMHVASSQIAFRRSGRSTLVAFRIFVQCYENPGTWVKIHDHAESYAPRASRFLFDTMRHMASDLGFFQMEFNHNRLEIRLNIEIEG